MDMTKLDETLIYRTKRRRRPDGLSDDERVAINLLWRKGVRVPILADVFNVSKNTIYYKALTGTADSYPTSIRSNSAADTNALIEHLGVKEAERRFLTDEIKQQVNAALTRELERRQKNDYWSEN